MNATDLTSIKPHLLRAWLGWCTANRVTPLLAVQPLPYVGLPATVLAMAAGQQAGQPLIFSLAKQAAANLGFTGNSLYFTTLFPGQRQPSTVEIPTMGWQSLRVGETGWKFDLSFTEELMGARRPNSQPWPTGTGGLLLPPQEALPAIVVGLPEGEATMNEPRKPSLVWNNPEVVNS